MLNLYAVVLGGRAKKCNTELHDTVFVVAETLEKVYPRLVNKWFGIQKHLHIDAYMLLKYIGGYEVILTPDKPEKKDHGLYFVNFGAYQEGFFGEVHQSGFFVATSRVDAAAQAKKKLCVNQHLQHCDDNRLVEQLLSNELGTADDVIPLTQIDQYFVSLVPTAVPEQLDIKWDYQRLDTVKLESEIV